MLFSGAYTALVTPFRDGRVDEDGFREFIEWQISEGIDGLVPCGTTGESATLSHAEHEQVIRICIDQVKKRVPVIAGAGSNNTREAVSLTRFAKEIGADAVLLITPYYNKPTQEGLYQHYKRIASEVSVPMIVYNVPGRTGVNLLPSTLGRMRRDIPEVVGVKEAAGNLQQLSEMIEECGLEFQMLSGEDSVVLPALAVGGCGCISVTSNIAPRFVAGMCKAWFEGNIAEAQRLHYELAPLNRAMFMETNPIPVKSALSLMGRMSGELRLPLTPLRDENQKYLKDVLARAKLI